MLFLYRRSFCPGNGAYFLIQKQQDFGKSSPDIEFIAGILISAGFKSQRKIIIKRSIFFAGGKLKVGNPAFQQRTNIRGIENASGGTADNAGIKNKGMISAW